MSDWGLVSFHYDYDAVDYHGKTVHYEGLISKAYKYPGVIDMVLHAYNGAKYFLEVKDDPMFEPEGYRCANVFSDWNELNSAFDVFFRQEIVRPGLDCVNNTLRKYDATMDDEVLSDLLFNCEGMYGWFYIEYTGTTESGYTMKYTYFYGESSEYSIGDVERAVDILKKENKGYSEEVLDSQTADAIAFFKDNAVLMTREEFDGYEDRGAECFRKMVDNR